MRVAIGGISHESSTFATRPTTLADFEQYGLATGAALIETFRGTKTTTGGFIDAAAEAGLELVPTIRAAAMPGGPVTATATRELVARLVSALQDASAAGPLAGVLLGLHGAMVSELDDDGESYTLRAVRDVVGPHIPIIVTLDLHGNITQEMVKLATAAIAYDEYPHTDMYERGYEAGLLMGRLLRNEVRPTMALAKVPLLASLQRQYTHAQPMLGVKQRAHAFEAQPGVLHVSYLPGFAWADTAATGFSIIVTTDNDVGRAQDIAQQMADEIWAQRHEFNTQPVPIDQAVQRAMSLPGPVVLADIGDNPGGGTPADGTLLLAALLRLGAQRAVVVPITDPEAVQQAFAAGAGARISLRLGGKVDRFHGEPLPVRGRVVRLTDGRYINHGPMGTGVEINLGPTAVLALEGERGGEVQVIVTTFRHQPTELEMLSSQGIEPTAQQIIAVKSSVHFRAAFSAIASEIIEVDTPGLTSPHLETLTYRKLPRPTYPLDQ